MLANTAARPRSAAIIVSLRRPCRSVKAPMGSPNSRLGSHSSAVRYPIWAAPACSASTAASGSATPETWSPNIEIVEAPQYRRKTRSRSSRGIMSGPPGPEVVRERDVQPADLARARRPQLRPDHALEVLVEHRADPAAQFLELGRG